MHEQKMNIEGGANEWMSAVRYTAARGQSMAESSPALG